MLVSYRPLARPRLGAPAKAHRTHRITGAHSLRIAARVATAAPCTQHAKHCDTFRLNRRLLSLHPQRSNQSARTKPAADEMTDDFDADVVVVYCLPRFLEELGTKNLKSVGV